MASELSDEELRRLYLDWCSTQIARRFLELSVDEVWLRSHAAASLPGEEGPSEPSVNAADRIPDYLELVRRTALLLAREMKLPPFEEWKDAYAREPEAFRADLLGGP